MRTTPKSSSDASDAHPAVRRPETLLKTRVLQRALFNNANFSSIATDAQGVIQIFNVGAERMPGYTAAEAANSITAADLHDPQQLIERAHALSVECVTPIAAGFEALVFKASRGIEDIYELTELRKDGSRSSAMVSETALRDAHDTVGAIPRTDHDMTPLKRILLVEDSPRDAESILDALDYLYRRGPFADRSDGQPAMILLDLKLSPVDGLEMLRQIKGDPGFKTIPVVMMTSPREAQDLPHSYQLGLNADVVKPMKFQDFVEPARQVGAFRGVINELPPGSVQRIVSTDS